MKIKIFADGADLKGIEEMNNNPLISGFTTNPTLMRKAGIKDYKAFSKEVLQIVKNKPVSFEVFSDDFMEMERQANEISSWGENVYVKIPITNTEGRSSCDVIQRLSLGKIKVNVTAVMTLPQVHFVYSFLRETPSIISVFAGRIADTGRDPIHTMASAVEILSHKPNIELLWASPRELLNIVQADSIGCHIITATNDILRKLPLIGKNLEEYSLETVKMFYKDSEGYTL